MAEILPNDIGLATYEDVGEVAKLRTAAKTVVEAINELYQNGGAISNILGEQIYVDGENNVIIGEGNVVYGKNNLLIGSNNVIVGNNLNFIADSSARYTSPVSELYYEYFDIYSNIMYYYCYWDEDETQPTLPFKVGDKVAVSVNISWTTENWDDWVYFNTPVQIAEITEINESSWYIALSGLTIDANPPDDTHIVLDYTYTNYFVPLNDSHILEGQEGCISFGGTSTGTKSVAMNLARATGSYSFAANSSTASATYAAALCNSTANKYSSFGANYGKSYGEYGTALNYGYNYAPYSLASGYYSRTLGRTLKVTGLNTSAKTITLETGQTISGLEGKTIILRCYNTYNSILWREATIQSITDNVITYTNDNFSTSSSSNYKEKLFDESYAFIVDTSSSYSSSNVGAGCYCVAGNRYTLADGLHTMAGADGAVIFGKYGNLIDSYALALANGTSLKAPGLAFKVLSDGSVHADAEYTTPCADYSEYFEWDDGNPDAEDRVGYFVKLNGEKIVKCGEFDKPLGIVSATPAIIGDSGEMHWKGKFLTDEFGRVQYHDVVIPAEYDEEMNLISEEYIERQPILNPEWNSSEAYIPRKERPEWSPVGVLGKLIVYDDGTLQSGDLCRPGANGIAVKSIENGYHVLKRISEDKVLVWFKE